MHGVVAHCVFQTPPGPTRSGSLVSLRIGIGISELAARSAGDATLRPAPVVTLSAMIIPHGRPDVMLVEIKTLYGPVRLSMPNGVALTVGRSIADEAEKLAPDGSLS